MHYPWFRSTLPLLAAAVLLGGAPIRAAQTVGLFLNDEASFEGYTLFNQLQSDTTYLIDNAGKQVHSWQSSFPPGLSAYLLPDGHLLRTARFAPGGSPFNGGGTGGRVEEFAWDGTVLWDYVYSNGDHRQHHDIERLPNGNTLIIAWELKSAAEAIAEGRNPAALNTGQLWPDHVIEVEPVGASGGNIVWEWHVWDHLVQDFDPTKANFGVVGEHPELVDINFPAGAGQADWLHANAVDYNPELDQIILSVRTFEEVWVLDHSTTTAEAASHSGGNSGKGGDLLYRWGNPEAYDRGTPADQKLFGQHDAQWIGPGLLGEGNILVFNNGIGRPGGSYSSIDEFVTPVDGSGDYPLGEGAAYGPDDLVWTYVADPPGDLYASFISGTQRLPNDDTLVCYGPLGTFFETTQDRTIVWEYVSPITPNGTTTQGSPVTNNSVFRAYRYASDYPGLEGQDLAPGDPLEQYTKPLPAPDGGGGTEPLTCSRSSAGDEIRLFWDVETCPGFNYHLIFGDLAQVASYSLQGSECGIGTFGSYAWAGPPPGDLFFLIVGVDGTGVYESSWGTDSSGAERNGGAPSNLCAVTTKDATETCP
jgi:hypothetical protein